VSPIRFGTGARFHWQGESYEVRMLLDDNKLNIANLRTGEMKTVPFLELMRALFAEELQPLVDGKPVSATTACAYTDLRDCPEELRLVAEHRLAVIQPVIDLPRHKRKEAIRKLVAKLEENRQENERALAAAFSVASIYRWIKVYLLSGRDLRVLVPRTRKRGGKGKSRLTQEEEQVVGAVLGDKCFRQEVHTIDSVHLAVVTAIGQENAHRPSNQQLVIPSRPTVARRIDGLDGEAVLVAKRGRRAAERELAQRGEMLYPIVPLQRVEMDHTPSDLIVVDQNDFLPLGRLTFTCCLEVATRFPLGYYLGFEGASYLAVMECLYHAIRPKEGIRERYGTAHDWLAYGIPYTLVVDNGEEFVGRDLDDACGALGIHLERAPVQQPEFKAAIERLFGTICTGLLHTLPGTTFSSILQRGDYKSARQACICLDDLEEILHLFLLDMYAMDFHRGLNGIPMERWQAAIQGGFFPRLPQSPEELRILLGRIDYRTILPYGIEFHSLRYNCDELAPLRTRTKGEADRKFKFKYNPSDMSRIYVYDPEENRHIEVPALAQEYTQDLSLWKHLVILRYARRHRDKVDIQALAWAQHQIQEVVQRSLDRKALSARSQMARWLKGGGGAAEQRTAAAPAQLEEAAALPMLPSPAAALTLEDLGVVEPAPAAATPDRTGLAFSLEDLGLDEAPSPPALAVDLDLEHLEVAEGWGVSHDLPGVKKEP